MIIYGRLGAALYLCPINYNDVHPFLPPRWLVSSRRYSPAPVLYTESKARETLQEGTNQIDIT